MIGLDTNVLVRYLTQDDVAQARRATALIGEAVRRGNTCRISSLVLCELVWVLGGVYGETRSTIAATLDRLLATVQFEVGDKDLVRRALDDYRAGPGDFADYLLGQVNRAAGCDVTATFDRKLKRSDLFRVLAR